MLLNGIKHAVVVLQRNVVPPCLAWHSVMLLLKAGQTIIFGEEERSSWKVLIAAALLTKDTGFALDAGKDLADRQGLVVKNFLSWIAKAEANRRGGLQGADVTLLQNLDEALKANYERAVTAQNDTPLSTVAFLLADETHQEKNPFLTVHQPIGAIMLDLWVHAHPKNGVLRLLQELLRGARIEGAPTNVNNILQVIFGPYYGGGDDLQLARGNPEANYGAYAFVGVYGGAAMATDHLTKWLHAATDAPDAALLKLLAVPQALHVGKLPTPMLHGDKVYTLPLGENFVQDGFVAQAYKAIHKACANAANCDDGTLQATAMAFYLDLNTESGKPSALNVVVRGQLSSRARHMPSIHGKAATLHEVPPSAQQQVMFMFLEHAGRDQLAKSAVVSTLFNMGRVSEEGVEVSEDRDRRTCVVNGAFFIKLSSSKLERLMKMVKPIDSATPVRIAGYVELTSEQAVSAMVVGSSCKVYMGASPAGLIHSLTQAGVAFTEIGGGGGAANSALAADLEAMKQQAAASEQAAAERGEQLTAALRQVQETSAAEMRALRTKVAEEQEQVESLRGDLGRAYNLVEANQRHAAAQAEANARRSEVSQATMMHTLGQMQQAHTMQAAVLMSLLQSNPEAVRTLQQSPALAGAEPASVVIGTNEGGAPVFDFNALIAPIGPRQGGQAAGPLPPDVQAAHDAEEAAVHDLHDAMVDQRSAWVHAHGQELAGGDDDNNQMQDGAAPGTLFYIDSRIMVDGHRNGQEYLVGSSVGGSNGDFAFKWIPSHDRRGVSAAADDAARRDERRILHGTPRLCLVWAVIVVYALLRRMWRQLGRQYASVHKARRRKVAGAGTILAASGLCGQRAGGGNMRWTVAACTMGSMSSGVILWLSLCGVLATQRNARFWVTVTSLALGTCNRSVTNANECCSCNSGTFDSVAGGRNTLRWWHVVATPTTSAHGPFLEVDGSGRHAG